MPLVMNHEFKSASWLRSHHWSQLSDKEKLAIVEVQYAFGNEVEAATKDLTTCAIAAARVAAGLPPPWEGPDERLTPEGLERL